MAIGDNTNRLVLRLAIPAMMEMILHTLVWTVDTAFIGQISPAALSGVNLGSSILYTISNVLGAVGVGASALVARNVGAKDPERAGFIGTQIIAVGIILGVAINSILLLNAGFIIGKLSPDPEVVLLGTQYLKIVVFGGACMIPGFMCNAVLRGSGNTVLPMVSAVVANGINIVGDYALIFGKFGMPEMGIQGAALATAVAQITSFVIVFSYLCFSKYKVKFNIKKVSLGNIAELRNIFKVGMPSGLESFMNEGSRLLGTLWLAQMGTISYAAHTVSVAAESLSFMPAYGFSIATGALVGQALGAGDIEGAEKAVKISGRYAKSFMAVLGLAFFFFSKPIAALFSNDLQTVTLAAACLKIGAFEQVAIAIIDIYSAALKGAGDTKTPFKIATFSNVFIRLPLTYLVVFVLRLEITYVWMATVGQYIVYAVIITYLYKRGDWKHIKII